MVYIALQFLVIQQQYVWYNYECQLVLFLMFPYYSKTPKILYKYVTILYWYDMVYTQLRVILVAGLRYVPFLLHVVGLGVIYRS